MNLINKLKTSAFIQQHELAALKARITLVGIISAVSIVTGVNKLLMPVRSKKREIVEARQIYCYFARLKTGKSLNQIGAEIHRDHATVLYSVATIKDLKDSNSKIRNYVEQIEAML